ncbi:unnamed protein product [Plutella xylostella]|uniref:(diamondback moth) hypothetical protein n=1 Tax=Plutella xylostella TaxID=51655 RepID=A0A8S4EAB2_PLUXY|nr:unnamed protein product [Plutella xylostella]
MGNKKNKELRKVCMRKRKIKVGIIKPAVFGSSGQSNNEVQLMNLTPLELSTENKILIDDNKIMNQSFLHAAESSTSASQNDESDEYHQFTIGPEKDSENYEPVNGRRIIDFNYVLTTVTIKRKSPP